MAVCREAAEFGLGGTTSQCCAAAALGEFCLGALIEHRPLLAVQPVLTPKGGRLVS